MGKGLVLESKTFGRRINVTIPFWIFIILLNIRNHRELSVFANGGNRWEVNYVRELTKKGVFSLRETVGASEGSKDSANSGSNFSLRRVFNFEILEKAWS